LDPALKATVQELSDLFDRTCQERHEKGSEEYGQLTYLENDTVGMLLEELADAANYARYTFIRIALLARSAGVDMNEGRGHKINLGPDAFTPATGSDR
jgi:hypothetical protein